MTTGKIGSNDLAATTETLVGTADENMVVNICLCNRLATDAQVRIAIGTGGSAADKDYLEYDAEIPGNGVLERTGIAVTSGEKIWVRSSAIGVSVRAYGLPAA